MVRPSLSLALASRDAFRGVALWQAGGGGPRLKKQQPTSEGESARRRKGSHSHRAAWCEEKGAEAGGKDLHEARKRRGALRGRINSWRQWRHEKHHEGRQGGE